MNAREVALSALLTISDGAYANFALKKWLEKCSNPLDKNLATNIVYGVLRHDTRLSFSLEKFMSKSFDKVQKEIAFILKIGAYQLFFLDKIPQHSAVSTSVDLAKKHANLGAAKFVNAVLRSLIRGADGINFADTPHIKFSHPLWMFEMWKNDYGREKALAIMKANNEEGEITYRNNEIQGLSSQKAVEALSPVSGNVVIDACAAPGGKSLYMAEMMQNKGRIIACDIHKHRIELIHKNAERVGASIIEPILWDNTICNKDWINIADKVLVDAPCSGLGVIHKKPDIKWKKSKEEIAQLAEIQSRILSACSEYVKLGGEIAYCTCTVNKTENNDVIKKFLANNTKFALISEEQIFPSKQFDGFYYSLLARTS